MSNLNEIQKTFIDKIFESNAFPEFIQAPYPAECFDVYRQSLFETCYQVLKSTFPYTWTIFEERNISIRQWVARFLQDKNNWPSSACLDDWGDSWPSFIRVLSEPLSDLAQYEWLCNLANVSPEVPALEAVHLVSLSEEKQMEWLFRFQPSCYVHYTSFPLGKFLKDFPMNAPHWVLVIRTNGQLLTYELKPSWAIFFTYLSEGKSLTAAYEKILETYPDFNLAGILAFLFEKKLCRME